MLDGSSSPSEVRGRILFVDDDADVLKAAGLLLRRHGLAMAMAHDPAEAMSALASAPIDVILLDLNFSRAATSGEEGLKCLGDIMAMDPAAVVVVVTGHSGVNVAVAAMRAGASDFVMKPWSNERLLATVNRALELARLRRRRGATPEGAAVSAPAWADDAVLLGDDAAMERARDLLRRAAPTDAGMMIYGEAGVGKSLAARLLHRQSARAGAALVCVDFAALRDADPEAELFGDRRSGREAVGALQAASGGALVLDEVGAMSAALQTRLAAVLASRRAAPLGGSDSYSVDVRLIATSRLPREALYGRGGLNPDLLYRLNTVELTLPPLAERGRDVQLLAEHFLRLFAARYGRPAKPLAPGAAQAIAADPWPGQVRALRAAMERCVVLSEGPAYEIGDIPLTQPAPGRGPTPRSDLNLSRSEKAMVEAALKRHSFNVSHAARELGLTRAALYRRMAKHGL